MNLGNLILSISCGSNTVVVFLIPSVTLLAKSKTPITGLVTAPTNPLPTPLKNPPAPDL